MAMWVWLTEEELRQKHTWLFSLCVHLRCNFGGACLATAESRCKPDPRLGETVSSEVWTLEARESEVDTDSLAPAVKRREKGMVGVIPPCSHCRSWTSSDFWGAILVNK